jgi:formyl-CoA transferase
MGNQHPSIAPYETLRCQDDLLAVCCGNDGQFQRLCAALGNPTLAEDERFATNPARVAHRAELVAALEARLATDTAESWTERLGAVGVPAGRVGDVADGFALAERLGLEPVVAVDGGAPQVRHPVRYSRTPVTRYAAPPRLGQHGDDIRRWLAQKETR